MFVCVSACVCFLSERVVGAMAKEGAGEMLKIVKFITGMEAVRRSLHPICKSRFGTRLDSRFASCSSVMLVVTVVMPVGNAVTHISAFPMVSPF